MTDPRLILASASRTRQTLLRNAGVQFGIETADADEPAIRQAYMSANDTVDFSDLALVLAAAKAEMVSEQHPGHLVIGADQLLVFENQVMAKASDMDQARDRLLRMRGKTHSLESAVCCVQDGKLIWSHTDAAHLTMRDISPEFVGRYLASVGENVLSSVGCYQLEAEGIQLFEKIEGNYFTILGLPMLPLLAFLRKRGLLHNE